AEGRKKEALESFHSALKVSPDYIPALQGAAQIEYEASSPAAVPLLRHLLRLRPEDRTSHGMLAVGEDQQGKCADAVPHFEKASSLFETQIDGLHAYGTCLVRLKQFEKAVSVFQKTAALKPDDRRERLLLASVQLMAHSPQEALATIQPLLESAPDGP